MLGEALPDTHALAEVAAHRWFGILDTDADTATAGGAAAARLLAAIATDGPGGGLSGPAMDLAGFGVRPAARGGGIGSTLMREVVRIGLTEGPVVHFGMWADNDGARRLYQRLGFTEGAAVDMFRAEGPAGQAEE